MPLETLKAMVVLIWLTKSPRADEFSKKRTLVSYFRGDKNPL